MYLKIDHNSGVPISTQIVDQVKYLVVSGQLAANEKLPSVRGLATQLRLNPTTVARVYRQLEAEGIIVTQQGRGCFVAPHRSGFTEEEKRRRLAGDIRSLVVEAVHLGMDYDALLQLIRAEVEKMHGGTGRSDEA